MSTEAAGLDGSYAQLATAVAALIVAGTGWRRGWFDRKAKTDDQMTERIATVVNASIALAAERRTGEHDCQEQLAALRSEFRAVTADLTAKVNACEEKHAAVARRLEGMSHEFVAGTRKEEGW